MITQVYSNSDLDRAVHLREVKDHSISNKPKYIPVWKGYFFFEDSNNSPVLRYEIPSHWFDASSDFIFLGLIDDIEWYCFDVSHIALTIEEQGQLLDIRAIFFNLSPDKASLLAYAKGLINWHKSYAYCGHCGHKTISELKGHTRVCTNIACKNIAYPRIDPSIIALIEYKPADQPAMCLLSRRKTENGYICSALAGFVEIGERLEDAVVREMKEEVNVNVFNIRYMASQPWPFPSTLMIGFFAETKEIEFQIDNKEIKDAKWYTALELETLSNNGELLLSKDDSIAQSLIKKWISENK